MIAVTIVHASRNAPTRVSSPRKTRMEPSSSETAAAPHQSQAGFMKLNGAGPWFTKLLRPGPPKLPNTFPAPCAKNIAARASLIGIVAQDDDVEIIFLNMAAKSFHSREPPKSVPDINRGIG